MQNYFAKSSGNTLVIVLVVVLVLVLAGGGVYLFLSSRDKGAEVVKNGDSASQDSDSDEDGDTTSGMPVDPNNPADEMIVGDDAVSVVTFDGTRFSPSSVDVLLGGKVTFKNESNKSFWPAVDPHPIHTDLPGFDAGQSIGAGKSVTFTFSKAGEWTYHNHLNSGQRGTVVVSAE